VSQVPLNLEIGSKDSKIFLEKVEKTNNEAFYTPFVHYIDNKWDKEAHFNYPIASLSLMFVFLIDGYACLHKTEPDLTFVIIISICDIILFVYELVQMLSEGIRNYLSDVSNYFDITGYILILYYCGLIYNDRLRLKMAESKVTDFLDSGRKEHIVSVNYHRDILSYGVFFSNIRFMMHMAVFNQKFRIMVRIII